MFPYLHTPSYKFGPFTLQAFGLLVATGVIMASILTRRWTEEQKMDLDLMIDSFFWILPGGFMLSHWVSTIAYYPERIVQNPLHLIYFWEGISSFGGFLGGGVIAVIYFHYRKVPVRLYCDVLAYGVITGYLFGRLGCMVAHDHPGMWLVNKASNPKLLAIYQSRVIELPNWNSPKLWATVVILTLLVGLLASRLREKPLLSPGTLAWMAAFAGGFALFYPYLPDFIRTFAVHWPTNWSQLPKNQFALITPNGYSTRLRFDLGLMEACYFAFLALVAWIVRSGKPRKEGLILGMWFVMYAPVRFFFDFLRLSSTDSRRGEFTPGQYMAVFTLALGVYFLMTLPERRWGEYGEELEREREAKKKKKKDKDSKKSKKSTPEIPPNTDNTTTHTPQEEAPSETTPPSTTPKKSDSTPTQKTPPKKKKKKKKK